MVARPGPIFRELILRGETSVVEAGKAPPLDPCAQFPLHLTDHGPVFVRGQGKCLAGLFGPAGAADAVGVGVGGLGKIEVDDVGDVGDVNAVGSNVGGHQNVEFAIAEAVQGPLAGVLGHVPL